MKLFGKKKELTHAERVSDAQGKAQGILGMFSNALNELEEVNVELAKVASEAKQYAQETLAKAELQAQEALAQAEQANFDIDANKAVQDMLKGLVR